MKRCFKRIVALAVVAALSVPSVAEVSACGGASRRVRVASPFYGGYPRAASNYRTKLPATPPLTYSRSVPQPAPSVQPAPGQVSPVAQPSPAAVQPRPRDQVAATTAASSMVRNAGAVSLGQATPSNAPTQNGSAEKNSAQNAEASALAALASIAEAAATPVPAKSESAPRPVADQTSLGGQAVVGRYRATLPSKVAVELVLKSDGTFSWTVKSDRQSTAFSGQYRVGEGRLTLVRSRDLQKMAGTLSVDEGGFTFTLDGSNNAGLAFQRV